MCGICGIVDFRSPGAELARGAEAMVAALPHRGPDDRGLHTLPGAALGHTRLSIIDVAAGRQPMSNEDGSVWTSYNGEVYNFHELRERLAGLGHVFRTRSDTEVLVHLYEQRGEAMLDELNGMFALAIYDHPRRRVLLARDRLGIKPLYYALVDGALLFASELKAILACGRLQPTVRGDAVRDYLHLGYVPAPKTIFNEIHKLPPACRLRFDVAGLAVESYWDLAARPPEQADAARIEGEITDRLARAVRMRQVSDVPLGAFLSGGIDSAAVVAMMSPDAQPPVTVTVDFEPAAYSEASAAARVARRYATRHHVETVRPDVAGVLETLAWCFDEPLADYSSVPTYWVSRAARRHVTVALSGDGGDEDFAGYLRHGWQLREASLRRRLPVWLRRGLLGPLASLLPDRPACPRTAAAARTLASLARDDALAYGMLVGSARGISVETMLTGDFRRELGGYHPAGFIADTLRNAPGDETQKLLYTDLKTFLPDDILTKVDRASMAVSLEVRTPFLDHTLVEYAFNIPADFKRRGRRGKDILRSAMRPHLPAETLDAPKRGFEPPMGEWLRGALRPAVEDVLGDRGAMFADYLDRRALATAWDQHRAGRANHAALLWAVLALEMWARNYARPATDPTRPVCPQPQEAPQ